MGFGSRDLTMKLAACGDSTQAPGGCTPTPPEPPQCHPTLCQSCTNTPPDCTPTPDCMPSICESCTNTPPACTPTPGGGGGGKRREALGELRQQLREALAQAP